MDTKKAMLLYSSKFLETVVDYKSLLETLSQSEVTESGGQLSCRCPNPDHSDNKPSFRFNPKLRRYICYGCGLKGRSVGSLIMKVLRCTKEDAVSYMRDFVHSGTLRDKGIAKEEEYYNPNIPFTKKISADFYPDYLAKRGVSIRVANFFNLEVSYTGKYMNRIIIPIYDLQGNRVGFQARTMTDDVPKTLTSPHAPLSKTLYNYHNISNRDQVIVVEGAFDVYRVFQAGFKSVVATFGNRVSEEQIRVLKGFRKVSLLPDTDEAGFGLVTSAFKLLKGNVEVGFVLGKDPGEVDLDNIQKTLCQNMKSIRTIIYEHLIRK